MIVDASGFEAPMAAATLFLPRGWQARGGVLWGREFMCTNGYAFDWAATPDGLTTVAVLPQEKWEWNNYGAAPSTPGCQIASISNVRQYLESVVQRRLPGANVLDSRVREDFQRQFAQLNQTTPMPLGEARTWVEAGELLFGFRRTQRWLLTESSTSASSRRSAAP